ncbi:MAG: lytic transglycosylase [Sulfurovum sp.]|nr:lytic transglycosylase [Sulfurovum sp.]
MKRVLNLFIAQEKKLRKASIPWIMLLVSTAGQASCSKLAKYAGMSQNNLEYIVDKLVKIETTTGKYHVKNSSSGAYGRYQIMPSTANFYAKKLGIPKHLWKKPYNQDKIFRAIMKANIKSLRKRGYKVSAFSLYATHQQGAGGFNAIMKNKTLTKTLEKNLRQNLPSNLRKTKKSELRATWISYWKKKLA